MALQVIRLEQGPDDDLPYRLDFGHFADELLTADPLLSATATLITAPTIPALAISAPAVAGLFVSFRISGGLDGTQYRIEVKGTTTAGRDIVAFIDLTVAKPGASV